MVRIEGAKRKDVEVVSKKSKTKRSRRKEMQQNSDKNKWLIQHPNIQSMDRREKVYVKDAGLNKTKAEKRQASIDPKLDLMSPEVKFGRILAGTDQRKRHAAVKKLEAYLKARCDIAEVVESENGLNEKNSNGISELDLLKLWKALWFTLYMADKRPVQDELSKHICKLLWCVVGTDEEDECAGRAYLEMIEVEERQLEEQKQDDGDDEYNVTLEEIEGKLKKDNSENRDGNFFEESDDEVNDEFHEEAMMEDYQESLDDSEIRHCRGAHLVSLFVRTFFQTIRRDWSSMDKYRIDKFYSLIRTMMHEIYEYMSIRSWNYGIVLLLNDAIFAEILKDPPNGLRYHLIDVCLEELAKVSVKAKTPLTEVTFLDVLEPFFGLCQTGRHDDTVQERVMEKVIDNFLQNYCVVSEMALREDDGYNNNEKSDKNASLIFRDVHVKTIAEFLFTLGSDYDTKDKYRKSLYDAHKKFICRLKKIGKDVLITIDEDENELCDDENDGYVDGTDDVNLNEFDKSIEFLKAETNEERSENIHDIFGDDGIDRHNDEPEKSGELVEQTRKESKKRKSIEQESEKNVDTIQNSNRSIMNKKKKKKIDSIENTADEEVIITLTEQQNAKKSDRMAKRKLKKQAEEEKATAHNDVDKSGTKHVSFGKKNRAKSHKASMKALKTAEPPSTKETVPEKGILRKNPKHKSTTDITSASVLSRKKRKRTTSYF